MKGLIQAIQSKLNADKRPKVAIGHTEMTPRFRHSIEVGSQSAEIVLVQGKDARDEVACKQLIGMAIDKSVDAIIRGQLHYSTYHAALRSVFPEWTRDVMCACLMRTSMHEWLMTPAVHDADASVSGRVYLAKQAAAICSQFGIANPQVQVLCADENAEIYEASFQRRMEEDRKAAIEVVRILNQEYKVAAALCELRIDTAICRGHVVVPMDGVLGNFLHRGMGFAGAELCGCFSLTRKLNSMDTSRFGDAFEIAIQAACALVNSDGLKVEEYGDFMAKLM